MTMSYRYRQRNWSGGDLRVHIHGHGDEDGHRYWYRNILPLYTIVYVCGHKYPRSEHNKLVWNKVMISTGKLYKFSPTQNTIKITVSINGQIQAKMAQIKCRALPNISCSPGRSRFPCIN